MMTRQHIHHFIHRKTFELIANVICNDRTHVIKNAGEEPSQFQKGWIAANTDLAYDFAEALAQTNPNFDRKRFLAACGQEDMK